MPKKVKSNSLSIQSEVESVLGVTMDDEPKNRRIRVVGFLVLLAFLGGMTLWSTLAPIESATMADGRLTVEGNRRTVQAVEQGKISRILVKEDELVKKGQLLVQMDNTRALSEYNATEREYFNYLAMDNRLLAERDVLSSIVFDPELLAAAKNNSSYQKLIDAQLSLFAATRKSTAGTLQIMNQQIAQTNEQIKGVQAQLQSVIQQYDLIEKEIIPVKKLAAERLIQTSKLLELQRHAAQLSGSRGEYIAKIALLKQRISEVKAKISTFNVEQKQKVLTSLRETQQQLGQLRKRRIVEQDILNNTQIRAPQDGSVVGMKFHTVGGVVKSSEALMEILPDDEFMVEARVLPIDIDVVHKGQLAKLQLVSLKQRNTPTILGEVKSISSATVNDPATNQPYYRAFITIKADQLDLLNKVLKLSKTQLTADMPVQVMIVNEKRTLFSYLFSPVKESFARAFREQ
jgi:HlyD family type I secretion membrane fusion protein